MHHQVDVLLALDILQLHLKEKFMEHQDVPEKLDEAIASAMELQAIELQLV